jgi:hypothetical protein
MSDLTSPAGSGRVSFGGGSQGSGNGSRIAAAELGVTHRVLIDPSRSMKAISKDVEALLAGLEKSQRQSGALLASELIAQVVSAAPGWNSQSVGLTVERRADVVHLEASGPAAPAIDSATDYDSAPDDPVADWGVYLIDSLADRWGLAGSPQRMIWAEINAP